MLYDKIIKERQMLENKMQELQSEIRTLPEGKLICSSNNKRFKWYRSDGKELIYLPKKQKALAEQLAYKKYLSLQLENITHEKNAIDFYLRHHDVDAPQKEQAFVNSPKYKELLSPFFKPLSQELSEWANAPYEKNNNHPEHLSHDTYSGSLVRSKSEAIIDMFLYKNKIPFRYECLLQLNDISIFPDFTIRHPKTGQIFYWEHFGMMDIPTYSKNTCSKLQLYISNGIFPSIQLITTYETKENPLNAEMVEKIVKYYFL